MSLEDGLLHISPPLFLVCGDIHCWKCGEKMPAIALMSPSVVKIVDEVEGEVEIKVGMLSQITFLPENVLSYIQERFPSFQMRYSKTTDSSYYANTCPNCDMINGDFFLHCEPDSPFCPMDQEEAEALTIQEIPLENSIAVGASYGGSGPEDLILAHARKVTVEQ
ncbi:MAG: hypothetical protein Q8J63_01005 [Candidatus Aquicultor sp.]|nr:hypothetical protein [Candidatus Aquicultor sp.]